MVLNVEFFWHGSTLVAVRLLRTGALMRLLPVGRNVRKVSLFYCRSETRNALIRPEGSGSVRKWRTLIVEVTFNPFATEWLLGVSQKDRIHDGVAGNLGRQKRFPCWKVQVGEFYEPIA